MALAYAICPYENKHLSYKIEFFHIKLSFDTMYAWHNVWILISYLSIVVCMVSGRDSNGVHMDFQETAHARSAYKSEDNHTNLHVICEHAHM